MSKKTKIMLITAASLVFVGCIIFGGVMTMLNWDFTKLSTAKYETNHHKINEDFTNITVVTNTADIVFVTAENGESNVVCYEQYKMKHSVVVHDGTLEIKVDDTSKWYDHIGIFSGSPKITITIPQGEYGVLSLQSDTGNIQIPEGFNFKSADISEHTGNVTNFASASETMKIQTSTGSIRVENISAGALSLSVSTGGISVSDVTCNGDINIKVSTGKTRISDVECKNIISSGNTGDISLENVIASEKISIVRSTGDVKFDGSDAAELFIKTDTGDVTGNLLTDKVFITRTSTGDISVPKTTTGGKCEIHTDTGDIKIEICKKDLA